MFGWLLVGLKLIYSGVQWAINFDQRQVGRQEQLADDEKTNVKQAEAELSAAVNPVSSVDELRRHNF